MRGTGSLKHCRNVEPFEELEIIRIELDKGFIVEPMLTAKFSYLLFVDIVGIVEKKKTPVSSLGISNIRSVS